MAWCLIHKWQVFMMDGVLVRKCSNCHIVQPA